jgi:hypothetical protein
VNHHTDTPHSLRFRQNRRCSSRNCPIDACIGQGVVGADSQGCVILALTEHHLVNRDVPQSLDQAFVVLR